MKSFESTRLKSLSGIWLALILVLSLAGRTAYLGNIPGFNSDEAWPMVQAQNAIREKRLLFITPTQRILTPTYLLMDMVAGRLLAPTVFAARISAVICGIAALIFCFWLAPKMFGKTTGFGASLLFCAAPTLIAFSRIGWEPSQIPLASLLAFYFCWKGNLIPLALTLAIAIIIHPTCVFLVPPLVYPAFVEHVEKFRFFDRIKKFLINFDCFVAVILLIFFVTQQPKHPVSWLGKAGHGTRLSTFLGSLWNLGELFSGGTVFNDFIQILPTPQAVCLGLGGLSMILLGGLGLIRKARFLPKLKWILRGGACSLFALLVIGGGRSFVPGYERFSLFLVAPGVLLVALGLRELIPDDSKFLGVCLAIASLLLMNVGLCYFRAVFKDGAEVAPEYWTGPVEPKFAAFEEIFSSAGGRAHPPFIIAADGFWTYWTFHYFAYWDPGIRVEEIKEGSQSLCRQGAFFVGNPLGPFATQIDKLPFQLSRSSFFSYGGRAILKLWKCHQN